MDVTALLIAVGGVLYLGLGGTLASLLSWVSKKSEQKKTVKGFGVLTRTEIISIILGWPLIVAAASIMVGFLIATILVTIIVVVAILLLIIAFIVAILVIIIGFFLSLLLACVASIILLSPFAAFPAVRGFVESLLRRKRPEEIEE